MKRALSELPEDRLLFVAQVARDADRPGYGRGRDGDRMGSAAADEDAVGEFPPHGIASTGLGDAAGHVWAFAARIRVHPDGPNLGGIIALLDAAVAELTVEMERGTNPLQKPDSGGCPRERLSFPSNIGRLALHRPCCRELESDQALRT
jgi:hypothetical protein